MAPSDLTITSAIAQPAAALHQSLVKLGGGILTLGGSNTYSGDTDVLAGTLALGASAALPAASNVDVSGGTLNLGGFSASAGTVTLQSVCHRQRRPLRRVLQRAKRNRQHQSGRAGGPDHEHRRNRHPPQPDSYQGGTFLNAGELPRSPTANWSPPGAG